MNIGKLIELLQVIETALNGRAYTMFINENNKLAFRFKIKDGGEYAVYTLDLFGVDEDPTTPLLQYVF